MTLTLTMLRCPPTVVPDVRQASGGEFSIGRSPDSDWVLPDSDKEVSRRHCVIAFRNGAWSIAGTSANGTFLNREQERLEDTGPRPLSDGDRIRFGAYEIEVSLHENDAVGRGTDGRDAFGRAAAPDHGIGHGFTPSRGVGGGGYTTPFGDGFADDPFAPASFSSSPAAPPAEPEPGFGTPSLPANFNPLLPEEEEFLTGPSAPDHAPAVSDAVNLPWPKMQLPSDWHLDDPPADNSPAASEPRPLPDSRPDIHARSTPFPPHTAAPPFVEPAAPAQAMPAETHPDAAASMAADRVAPPSATPLNASSPTASSPTASSQAPDLLAAFLRGAALEGVAPADAERMMEGLGAAFRALVTGLRQALITRSSTKREFRIGATMIQARGNNPLKFSANDDDALIGLLGVGRRSDMSPEDAVRDALEDICQHELAIMPAMQTALRGLVARLAPEAVQKEAEAGGALALLGNRKARAWDAYETLHGQVARGLTDNFDSIFGKQFALAYEQIVEELAAGRRPWR